MGWIPFLGKKKRRRSYAYRSILPIVIGACLAIPLGLLVVAWTFSENKEPWEYYAKRWLFVVYGLIGFFATLNAFNAIASSLAPSLLLRLKKRWLVDIWEDGSHAVAQWCSAGVGAVFGVVVMYIWMAPAAWFLAWIMLVLKDVPVDKTWDTGGFFLGWIGEMGRGGLINALTHGLALVVYPFILFLTPIGIFSGWEILRRRTWFRHFFTSGSGPRGEWAGPSTYGALVKAKDQIYYGHTTIADTMSSSPVMISDDAHILTIGQPGSGKSQFCINPNIPIWRNSMIVVDPKGDHARRFMGVRQRVHEDKKTLPSGAVNHNGTNMEGITRVTDKRRITNGRAFSLDPFNLVPNCQSASYNVLSELDVNDPSITKLLGSISHACVVSKGDPRSEYWENLARRMLEGVIVHVLTDRPKECQNLPYVADVLLGIHPETGEMSREVLNDFVAEMSTNDAVGRIPQRAASDYLAMMETDSGSSYLTTELNESLKWCTNPTIRQVLIRSDFKFSKIAKSVDPYTVFISLPFGELRDQSRWLRTVVDLSMRVFETRDEDFGKRNRILYLLDELPRYGQQLNAVKDALTTLRGAGVKLWAFIQERNQLVECYGKEGANSFEATSTLQCLGVKDQESLEWISTMLGWHPSDTNQNAPLADPREVADDLGLGSEIQYVFSSGKLPMRLTRRSLIPGVTIEGTRYKICGFAQESYDDKNL